MWSVWSKKANRSLVPEIIVIDLANELELSQTESTMLIIKIFLAKLTHTGMEKRRCWCKRNHLVVMYLGFLSYIVFSVCGAVGFL